MARPSFTPDRLSLPEPFPLPGAWRGSGGDALFSPCGRYRWWLVRHWHREGTPVLFLGLNPSTANGGRDDPTVRLLQAIARRWGHGHLLVMNLFSRVGRNPAQLRRASEPVGGETEAWLATALAWLQAHPPGPDGPPPRVWVGWGQRGGLHARDQQVLDLLRCWKGEVVCLGFTHAGHPRHPLFCPTRQAPLPFSVSPSPCHALPVVTPST